MRTVSTLRALEGDYKRQTSVIHFLREAELYDGETRPALLAGAIMQGLNLSPLDLRGANLQEARLWNAKLQGADLSRADLQGADLRVANLQETHLIQADLQEAKLPIANLQAAFLGQANLQGADLTVANLLGADLNGANLQGAHLFGANLLGANLNGAKLRQAKGITHAFFNESTTLPDGTKWTQETDVTIYTRPDWEPTDPGIRDLWRQQGWLSDNADTAKQPKPPSEAEA